MKKTIYMHIGTHKTGSTSIQVFLYNNSEFLKQQNFDYLQNNCISYAHQALGWSFQGNYNAVNQFCEWKDYGVINYLEDEINKSDCNNFIISSENLFLLHNTEFIDRFFTRFKEFNVEIILYLREQSSFIESWYLELIRADYYKLNEDIEVFINNPRYNLDYYSEILKWQKYINKENIHVFNFNEIIKKEDLIEHFLNLLGLDDFKTFHKIPKMHESINHSQMLKMKEINSCDLSSTEWNIKRDEILKNFEDTSKAKVLDDFMKTKIKQDYFESNKRLKSEFNIQF